MAKILEAAGERCGKWRIAAEAFGNLAETFSNLAEIFSNLAETLSNLAETFSNLAETFGNLAETFGNLTETFGNVNRALKYKFSKKFTKKLDLFILDFYILQCTG
jgi:ABC-type transporter Mla subunit MlaD